MHIGYGILIMTLLLHQTLYYFIFLVFSFFDLFLGVNVVFGVCLFRGEMKWKSRLYPGFQPQYTQSILEVYRCDISPSYQHAAFNWRALSLSPREQGCGGKHRGSTCRLGGSLPGSRDKRRQNPPLLHPTMEMLRQAQREERSHCHAAFKIKDFGLTPCAEDLLLRRPVSEYRLAYLAT